MKIVHLSDFKKNDKSEEDEVRQESPPPLDESVTTLKEESSQAFLSNQASSKLSKYEERWVTAEEDKTSSVKKLFQEKEWDRAQHIIETNQNLSIPISEIPLRNGLLNGKTQRQGATITNNETLSAFSRDDRPNTHRVLGGQLLVNPYTLYHDTTPMKSTEKKPSISVKSLRISVLDDQAKEDHKQSSSEFSQIQILDPFGEVHSARISKEVSKNLLLGEEQSFKPEVEVELKEEEEEEEIIDMGQGSQDCEKVVVVEEKIEIPVLSIPEDQAPVGVFQMEDSSSPEQPEEVEEPPPIPEVLKVEDLAEDSVVENPPIESP